MEERGEQLHAVRDDGGQSFGIDLVDAAELPECVSHGGVDLAAREPSSGKRGRVRRDFARTADGWSQLCDTPIRRSPSPSA